ncbi:MAG: formylglycine-generating enzyme family protein, partial [Ketobacter sp.]|nr:formylglycine-generating enzyme family protein [Ketobacter sp.]
GEADARTVNRLVDFYQHDKPDAVRHLALQVLLTLGQAEKVDMVLIPKGEFLMGSSDADGEAKDIEKPQHPVYLPAYYMDITPVTNAQFARFMAADGYANPAYWAEAIAAQRWQDGTFLDPYAGNKPTGEPRYWQDKTWNGAEQPVVGVSWYEAMAYARWAGKRLPSEAEWEKAARGTDGRIYPWGNEWESGYANSKESKLEKTSPVGQYAPSGNSPFGVIDMAGNVWEWCSTRYRDEKKKTYAYPYNPNDGREDLSGGDEIWRMLKGGSWYEEASSLRCGVRFRYYPGYWRNHFGFRCCCATSLLTTGSGS